MAKTDQPTVTAEEYVNIDGTPETGEVLTDDQILEMVTDRDTPEHADSEGDDDTQYTQVHGW